MSAGRTVALLEEDRELADVLSPRALETAREAVVARVIEVPRGPWEAAEDLETSRGEAGHLGFLVLDGILLRGFDLGGAACTELLGTGDLLRPWYDRQLERHTLASEARWQVVEPARLAELDAEVAAAIGAYPELTAALLDRLMQREHSLAFHLAVCSLASLEVRLLAALWNLADRWGRVGPDGVRIPLRLTHDVLAELVGARRPSVSNALGRLRRRGLVSDIPGGGWLLHGSPPEELAEVRRSVMRD